MISEGKKYLLLGVSITIKYDSKVEVEMKDCLEKSFLFFGEDISEKSSTLEAKHIWNVDRDAKELNKIRRDIFRSVAENIPFITKRVRPDIDPKVPYLCTRVKK